MALLRLPAGPTSVPVPLAPHRLSAAISPSHFPAATPPSRVPAAATSALKSFRLPSLRISVSSAAIRVTPVGSATRSFQVLRARRTDGEDDVTALPEVHASASASAIPEIDDTATALHDCHGAAYGLPHSDSTASTVSEIDDTVSALHNSTGASSVLPCTASSALASSDNTCSANPCNCVAGPPNTHSVSTTVKAFLVRCILKVANEGFFGYSVVLHSLAVLTVFTFLTAVATMLYKAAKESKEMDGIVTHIIQKCEKILESQDKEMKPHP